MEWDEYVAAGRQKRIAEQKHIPTITARMSIEEQGRSSCGPGWNELLIALDADLALIDPKYTIQQYKEKWGALCFHAMPSDQSLREPFYARIKEAQEKSLTICEICGKPGSLSKKYPIQTVCNEHWASVSPEKQTTTVIELLKSLQRKLNHKK